MKKTAVLITMKKIYRYFQKSAGIGIAYIWKPFLGNIGNNVRIAKSVKIYSPENVYIGNNVSINFRTILDGHGKLSIGDNTLIGNDVSIYTANHSYKDNSKPIIDQPLEIKEVVIGRNVWIGTKTTILPGVAIGDNTVIGANAVVTKSFPANSLLVGNPAIRKKKLYE